MDETNPGSPDTATLERQVEALLMSADRPLTDQRLVELLELSGKTASSRVREAIEALNVAWDRDGRAVRIERLAGGWQVLTCAEHGPLVARLHRDRQQSRLSPAALETLAIVAYRQPILRAELEAIRGVACGEVLRGLLERRLVKIVGRAEELGRPMLYGTTREFLKVFGLANLGDLPEVEGLDPRSTRRAAKAAVEAKPQGDDEETPDEDTGDGGTDAAEGEVAGVDPVRAVTDG